LVLVGAVAIDFALGVTPAGPGPVGGGEVAGASLEVLGVITPAGAVAVAGPPLFVGGSCVLPMPGSVFWLAGGVTWGAVAVALALISPGVPGFAVGLATKAVWLGVSGA
jgi:hypothetical protein